MRCRSSSSPSRARRLREEEAQAPGAQGAAGTAPGGAARGDVVLVGHVGSLTGSEATFGHSTDKAVRLAIDEANAKGGVKGKKLAVKTYDDQGKPEESAVAATRLVVEDKVSVLLGEVASTRSLAMAPIADSNKVPMISPVVDQPQGHEGRRPDAPVRLPRLLHRPVPGHGDGEVRARATLKVSKVAVLRDVGNDYSRRPRRLLPREVQGARRHGRRRPELHGGRPGLQGAAHRHQGDRSPRRSTCPATTPTSALIARQARELGIRAPLLGGDGWDSRAALRDRRQGARGLVLLEPLLARGPVAAVQEFVKKYKARYGAVPDSLAAQAYDAAQIAVDAMGRAKELAGAGDRATRSPRPRTSRASPASSRSTPTTTP